MSKYVMSDIHGEYYSFMKMIDKIKFDNEKDELWILGDVLDRGDNPLKVIDYIVDNKNIHLLKGNHELMFQEYYEGESYTLWCMNGGDITHSKLLQRELGYEKSLYKYIKNLPSYAIVDNFILVHASIIMPYNVDVDKLVEEKGIKEVIEYYNDEESMVWTRQTENLVNFKDYKVICGHTPVQSITHDYDNVKILHKKGVIFIDCGCTFKRANGKLACLRLDDMKEFYV